MAPIITLGQHHYEPQEGASAKLDLILFKCFIHLSRLWVPNPEGGPSTSIGTGLFGPHQAPAVPGVEVDSASVTPPPPLFWERLRLSEGKAMNLIIMCLACVQRGGFLYFQRTGIWVSAQNHRRETILASVSRKLPASCLFISLSTPRKSIWGFTGHETVSGFPFNRFICRWCAALR